MLASFSLCAYQIGISATLMANQVFPREARLDAKPSSPRNNTTLNWRDFFNSSWKDTNYKRRAIASLIQAVYLLELDRQENRTKEDSLAPNFWIPFKYKPTQILIDERDGSIFGAIFEFDRLAAFADFKPFKPIGAPRAVLALRGTLIRLPTMRRDFEDDFRFVTGESLNGSVRFRATLDAVKSVTDTHGSRNVCIAGHSLGAGFGLQVGKELAKERINVESHLFNPPSVSLAMGFGNVGEKFEYVWNRVKPMLPSGSEEAQVCNDEDMAYPIQLKRLIPRLSRLMDAGSKKGQWVPHLYVNSNDWISFFYMHTDHGTSEKITDLENLDPTNEQNAAKLFVVSKEDQQFLEAHGLKQWWSSDAEPKQDIHDCKLISMQLRSLNTGTPSQVIVFYYPRYVSSAMSLMNIRETTDFVWLMNIRETTDFVWNRLKSVPYSIGKAQVSSDGDNSSGKGLKGWTWIPQLSSGLKDAAYWVRKWVPQLSVNKNDGTEEKVVDKKNTGPAIGKITEKLFVVSKEQQKYVTAHGLEQWWPNDGELQQAIQDGKLISRHISSLCTRTPWKVTKRLNPSFISLSNIGEKEEFTWKWNNLKSMFPSSSEAQVSNEGDMTSGVGLKGWMPPLSGFKDADFEVFKCVPHMYSNNSDYISSQLRSLYSATSSQVSHLCNLPSVPPAMSIGNIGEKAKFVWNRLEPMCPSSSEAQVSNDADKTSCVGLKSWIPLLSGFKDAGFGVGKLAPYLCVNKSGGTGEKMVDK